MTAEDTTELRLQEAGLWWVRLREPDLSPEELNRWLAWCQLDPANLREFERIEQLGAGLGAIEAAERSSLVQELLVKPAPPSRRRRRWQAAAIAAGLAAASLVAAWQYRSPAASQRADYHTALGERRDLQLADGSTVTLGARSALSVDYTRQRRGLELDDGEAYFQVEHNPQRPFVVRSGALRVTAVGTAFDIRKTGTRVEVVVTRGVVDVEPAAGAALSGAVPSLPQAGTIRVSAGQRVVADAGQTTLSVQPADRQRALAWRTGSLEFIDEALPIVIANLDRYAHSEVVIADPSLNGLRYTGTIVQGHEEEWLSAIEKTFPIVVHRDAQGRIELFRRAAPSRGVDAGRAAAG